MNTLYLVSTPIGNLDDITKRALQVLFSADIIACEDTRKTLNLINHFRVGKGRAPKLLSYFEENELQRIPEIINLLKEGNDIALVTNAGTPTISDPGFKLVRECWKENIKVVPIPGACSPIAALSASGLPTDKFSFLGFLPSKSSQRIKLLHSVSESLKILPSTIIFMESPFRIKESLLDLKTVFGDIEIVFARELTKIYEEFKKGKISEIEKDIKEKGEFIVLFNLRFSV